MTSLTTDFNVSPYFDDYSEDKNFYKFLFRPSTAIQARELTQLQTILQKQIERFGNHIFKDGSVVDGVGITYYANTHYLSLEDALDANGLNTNTSFLISDIDSTYLITNSTDSNVAVRAVSKISKDGIKLNAPNTNRMYFDYVYTGKDVSNNDVSLFSPGDKLYIYNSNQSKFGELDNNNLFDTISTLESNATFTANGFAYCVGTTDGIIFQKGYFSKVDPHIITVRDFSTNVSNYVVGFNTSEIIISENEDTSLNDNALGYSNENAPGSHRLRLTPTLVAKEKTDTANSTEFFAIIEFDKNQPVEQNDDPSYNRLIEQFSRRTYEESGDYAVYPFKIETLNHSSNNQLMYYGVSPGVAYVRGHRVEKIGPSRVEVERGITTEYAQNQLVTANYGNYVICDEYLGAFDYEQLSSINLYDQPQNAISDKEGIEASPSGNVVGTANVRAVVYSSGSKGNPTTQYRLYLFNIKMNTGKSFSTDVKSFYVDGTFGKAKADVVLENGRAVLKETAKNQLYFYNGLSATKSLTNNTGIGDTSFVFNQISSATMTSVGATVVNIDVAGPGGSEKLNATTGTIITGNGLNDYDIKLASNAYSANLTGTLSLTAGSLQIVGTGTEFTSELSSNSLIRINDGSNITIKRVTSVSNSSVLYVDSSPSVSNSSANYQLYFVSGTPLPISSISINSNTQFTANLGLTYANNLALTLDSGSSSVYASYPIFRTGASAIKKEVRKNRLVKIDCSNNAATSVGPWNLGLVDVYKIRNVYVGDSYSNTNTNRIDWFNLNNGQTDSHYDQAQLVIKPQYSGNINSSTKILVELDHFEANTSSSVGFFSVESYQIDDANTANTNAIQTIEIPYFDGNDLRNFIDFRPQKYNSANSVANTDPANTFISVNPVVNNDYSVSASGSYIVAPDENFIADFEYYLPRVDLLTLNRNGDFIVQKGFPSTKPKIPFVENDQSVVAEIFVPAYPTATQRQREQYPSVSSTRINIKTNRRYTMKDIGVLEERIKRLEYYTVLSSLEQSAKDLTIPDANGLNRFKNGIFADPFNSHNIGNVSDFEYKIAIDPRETVARPFYDKHDVDFTFNSVSSTNVQKTGPLITLPYNSDTYISQRYATKFRNACESVWQWNGILDLYPSYDFFRDEERAPNVNVDLDLAAPWEQFAQSPFASIFGDWDTVSQQDTTGQSVTDIITSSASDRWGSTTTTTTTTTTPITTTTVQQQIINTLKVDTITSTYDLGSYVSDVSINPYMRSRLVAFVSYNMKPNTTLYAFFDGVNVSQHCAPGVLSGLTNFESGLENRAVNQNGNFGDALVSDGNGFICGIFNIPEGQFRTGDRVFELTNVSDLEVGGSARITNGKATYTADNVSVTKGSTTLSVRQPLVSHETTTQSRTQSATRFVTDSTTSVITNFNEPSFSPDVEIDGDAGGDGDPISQSFIVDSLPSRTSGLFITKIGVYFQSKDSNLGCSVYVCEMENGLPNMARIVGKSYLPSSSISTSSNGQTETQFTLEYPVYLLSNQEYAFVVQPDGNSPEYNVWVGETGGFDVVTDEQVYSNPYSGVMFVSANRRSWTPIQKEDIKFNIYRATFTESSGSAIFENEADEYITVDGFTAENTSLSLAVGDVVYSVSSSTNNTLIGGSDPFGIVQYVNQVDGKLWIDTSRGGFSNTVNPGIRIYKVSDRANTSLVVNANMVASANIQSVDNLVYHAVVPKFGVLQPSRTSLQYNYKGTDVTNALDPAFIQVTNETEYEFNDVERHAMSYSNEINNLSSNKSSTFRIDLNSETNFVSPVINLSRKSVLFIQNIINNDTTDEHTRYGNAETKYVSKKVVLADGQDAEDLKVFLTAYRPAETDIKLYVKVRNNQDPDSFDNKVWSEMEYANNSGLVFSSPSDNKDYIEYEFKMPQINSVAYAAFANTGANTYNPLAGGVSILSNSTTVNGKEHLFSANSTGVNTTNDTFLITNANTFFNVGDKVTYSANGGTALADLTDGSQYYVSFSNSTSIAISNSRTGANIDLTAVGGDESHIFTGTYFLEDFSVGTEIKIESDDYIAFRTITNIQNNTSMTVDKGLDQSNTSAIYYVFDTGYGDGIVEYTSPSDARYIGFKEFAIKIILLSSNAVKVPKLQDVRSIALQI